MFMEREAMKRNGGGRRTSPYYPPGWAQRSGKGHPSGQAVHRPGSPPPNQRKSDGGCVPGIDCPGASCQSLAHCPHSYPYRRGSNQAIARAPTEATPSSPLALPIYKVPHCHYRAMEEWLSIPRVTQTGRWRSLQLPVRPHL